MIRNGWSNGLSPIWGESFCVENLPAELIGSGDDESKRRQVFDDLEHMVTQYSAQCEIMVSGHIVTDHEEPQFATALFMFNELNKETEWALEKLIKYSEIPVDEVDVHCLMLLKPPAESTPASVELFNTRKQAFIRSFTENGYIGCPIIRKGAA